jgi:hypothetical protein
MCCRYDIRKCEILLTGVVLSFRYLIVMFPILGDWGSHISMRDEVGGPGPGWIYFFDPIFEII